MAASYCQQTDLLPHKACGSSVFAPYHDSGELSDEVVTVGNGGD